MELPHIGQVCVICQRNDYLPFRCDYCDKVVCIDHKTDHGQECPLNQTSISEKLTSSSESLKSSCDFCKKATLILELVKCSSCARSHCLNHRHQPQHSCSVLEQQRQQHSKQQEDRTQIQNEALEKLKQSCKSVSAPTTAQIIPSADLKKQALAKRLRIMRFKQSARGPPNINDCDKLFFEAIFVHQPKSKLSKELKNNQRIKFFTSSKHTVGRLVDWVAEELDLVNKNNLSDQDELVFYKNSTEPLVLDNQKTFQEYLLQSQIDDGDELCMTYNLGA